MDPAWLCIGHKVPVYDWSGLVPMLPTFTPHVGPTYCIDGKQIPAPDLLCDCCQNIEFDVKLKPSSSSGHIICARLWDVAWKTEPEDNSYDPELNPFEYREKDESGFTRDLDQYIRRTHTEYDSNLEAWAQVCKVAICGADIARSRSVIYI